MNYYGHTADDEDGRRLPEGHWQLLRKHLLNVAELAEKFATPFNLGAEAKLARLLHDLGKYAKRFQDRLHDNSIHGVNHWAAGTVARSFSDYDVVVNKTGLQSGVELIELL